MKYPGQLPKTKKSRLATETKVDFLVFGGYTRERNDFPLDARGFLPRGMENHFVRGYNTG